MKNAKVLVVAGAMGAVVATGGIWTLSSGDNALEAKKVADGNGIVGTTTDTLANGAIESEESGAPSTAEGEEGGGPGTAEGEGNGGPSAGGRGAPAPERVSTSLNFARGKGPFTHQSDELYVSFEGQPSCLRGKAWSMVATFHVRDVTAKRAYVSKIVATYRAPVKKKRAYLGAQSFYQADGKHLLQNNVAQIVIVPAGGKVTQTHVVNRWVDFSKGPATFLRRAQIGQASGTKEAVWCGGTGGLEVKVRPR